MFLYRGVVTVLRVLRRILTFLLIVMFRSALQQAVAPAASGTDLLRAKPVHHVTGVSSVAAAQAEVRRAAYGHMTDGALEGEALADGALGAAGPDCDSDSSKHQTLRTRAKTRCRLINVSVKHLFKS